MTTPVRIRLSQTMQRTAPTGRPSAALSLALAVAAIGVFLIRSLNTSSAPDWHGLYLTALAWAYVFWNSVRILTYLPTLRMLLKPGASAEHYSVTTWASWVCSNGTLALYLFETSGHRFDSLVLLNTGNTIMCFLTCMLILRLRRRESKPHVGPAGVPPPCTLLWN